MDAALKILTIIMFVGEISGSWKKSSNINLNNKEAGVLDDR